MPQKALLYFLCSVCRSRRRFALVSRQRHPLGHRSRPLFGQSFQRLLLVVLHHSSLLEIRNLYTPHPHHKRSATHLNQLSMSQCFPSFPLALPPPSPLFFFSFSAPMTLAPGSAQSHQNKKGSNEKRTYVPNWQRTPSPTPFPRRRTRRRPCPSPLYCQRCRCVPGRRRSRRGPASSARAIAGPGLRMRRRGKGWGRRGMVVGRGRGRWWWW